MRSIFSTSWVKSVQPRKQRKYNYNAPLHIKGSFLHAQLSKDLRKKYNIRSLRVRKGDKVTIMRGQFKKVSGSVEKVDMKKGKIFVKGAELEKKDGGKVAYPIHPSNLQITTLILDDKKRIKTQTVSEEKK